MTGPVTVDLVAMTAQEFDAYVEETVPGYAAERAEADGIPYEAALDLARRQVAAILQGGAAGASHGFFVCDRITGSRVGAVWALVRGTAVHLADIRIDERFRRRGFGAAALAAVESFARASGARSISLHVFGRNTAARALYEDSGYGVTGLSLRKDFG